MKAATLLIFLVSHQGYWLAGQDQTISARWVAKEGMPAAADLVWELDVGAVRLAGGAAALQGGERATVVTIKAPDVRVRSTLRWAYKIVQKDAGGKVLETGELPLHAWPADLIADWPKRVGNRKLLVWDNPDGLPKALSAAKVPFTRVDGLSGVLDRPDLILIGPDQIDDSTFAQGPLVNFAKAGSSVAVFEQKRPSVLAGYTLARRELGSAGAVRFRSRHPLFAGLEEGDLTSWLTNDAGPLRAIQLPPDEPALELAWWPREVAGEQAAPIDALLVTRSLGRGRIVLCQLPLGGWGEDPRSQLFLGNLLSYLSTRPEPTPPPSRRPDTRPVAPPAIPTITIPAGVKP